MQKYLFKYVIMVFILDNAESENILNAKLDTQLIQTNGMIEKNLQEALI